MSSSASSDENRVKQVLVGLGAILVVAFLIGFGWAGRMIPGFIGEWFGVVVGIVTTPVLMETSFIILGLLIVLVINYWRMRREGDELVYLEQAEGPGTEDLPDSARWAVYRDEPLKGEIPPLLARAEGAFELGDHQATLEALAEMSDKEREAPKVLELRIRLAEVSGKEELADRLRKKLEEA
ncbi:MAG: hypothetical protein AAGI48_11520 [Verrucomicrobiota bacterium]